jgi:DNA-binding beta-propeller fold protein YncE
MSLVTGSGDFVFKPQENWARLPDGWELGDVAGVAVDDKDRVYLFNRGPHPLIVLDQGGNYLKSWGEGVFTNPHGASIGADGAIYLTDNEDHTIRKYSLDGKLLMQIGESGKSSGFMSGRPFCRCTHTALSPVGDIYVSDGYGNACVHKYAPDGKHLFSWGQPGTGEGEFNLPHNICCDDDGWVYVADRENHRIQVFDGKGRYETQIHNIHRPSGLAIFGGSCPICLIGELGSYLNVNRATPNIGPRVSITTCDGKVLSRLGVVPAAGTGLGQFVSPHSLAMDSRGDLYVGEVGSRDWSALFPDQPMPVSLRRMQKFVRIPVT